MSNTTPLLVLDNHKDIIRSLAFSPDGTILASLSIINDKSVILWNTATWAPITQFYSGPGTTMLYFSLDGSNLIGTGVNKEIRLWDIPTGIERIIPTQEPNGKVRFTASKTAHLIVCNDNILTFYHLETCQLQKHVSLPHPFSSFFQHCGWLNEDATLLAIVTHDHSIQLWNIEQEQMIKHLIGHKDNIRDIDFHPHEHLLASVSGDGTINIWNLIDGTVVSTYHSSATDIWEIRFNPQFPLFAVVNGENYIELWNMISGTLSARLAGHDSQITVAFSPDGKLLASGSDDFQIRIWTL